MTIDLRDSTDKIISRYFSAVTTEEFEYKRVTWKVKPLHISPGIFTKTMVCVANCGGCCRRFTNDWLPNEIDNIPEDTMEHISPRQISINEKQFTVFSDTQEDHGDYYCRNLKREDGRCGIHTFHPFSCDFELLRFKEGENKNWLGYSPFGRGWQMMRIDGERGAFCEWGEGPCTEEWKQEVVRRLLRLKDWTDYFQIQTIIPNIVKWVRTGPHNSKLVLNEKKKGFGL